MNKIPLTYEEFNGHTTLLQVNYDWDGKIEQIFVYSPIIEDLVMVDLERFESRHPSRYAYIQNRVLEALNVDYARLA